MMPQTEPDSYDELQDAASEAMEAFIEAVHKTYPAGRQAAVNYAIAMMQRQKTWPTPAPLTRKRMTAGISRAIWDRDGWECQHCGIHCDLTVDHIIAVANGGTDDMDNLQTLCKPCNSRKGTS